MYLLNCNSHSSLKKKKELLVYTQLLTQPNWRPAIVALLTTHSMSWKHGCTSARVKLISGKTSGNVSIWSFLKGRGVSFPLHSSPHIQLSMSSLLNEFPPSPVHSSRPLLAPTGLGWWISMTAMRLFFHPSISRNALSFFCQFSPLNCELLIPKA